jgi:pyrroline-5-carboxylate reductase
MKNLKICIIGGGNIGGAVARGFVKSGMPANQIYVTDRRDEQLNEFSSLGIVTGSDNKQAVVEADIVIVAVKPYLAEDVLEEIRGSLVPGQMVASLMAGIDIKKLKLLLPEGVIPLRVMPNTAVALQESMTCISAPECTDEQKDVVRELFEALGVVIYIDEELMGAATVLGSCGIAFALRYIRAATQGGIELGFGAGVAQQIVAQTVKGATELVMKTEHHPEREIDKVTTPKGITISGLNEMEHQGFSSALIKGLITSFDKINNK